MTPVWWSVTCSVCYVYCLESYPGDTCLVVCARGRNNVPECQVYFLCKPDLPKIQSSGPEDGIFKTSDLVS